MELQVSLKVPITVEGINVYNGRKNKAIFHPAKENAGISFRRKGTEVSARLENAFHHHLAIFLENHQQRIGLVEHALSVTYALGIDNVVIELSDGICPTTDNCAKEYVEALREARVTQTAEKRFWSYAHPLETIVRSEKKRRPDFLQVQSGDGFHLSYFAFYPHKVVREQKLTIPVTQQSYEQEIMDARSIAFLRNEALMKFFLQLGTVGFHGITSRNYLIITTENAMAYANPAPFGVRHNGQEFVRHKILDVLGTLALTGRQFRNTHFYFHMTGHAFDLYALKTLFKQQCLKEIS